MIGRLLEVPVVGGVLEKGMARGIGDEQAHGAASADGAGFVRAAGRAAGPALESGHLGLTHLAACVICSSPFGKTHGSFPGAAFLGPTQSARLIDAIGILAYWLQKYIGSQHRPPEDRQVQLRLAYEWTDLMATDLCRALRAWEREHPRLALLDDPTERPVTTSNHRR
jgi:hypothetical protein